MLQSMCTFGDKYTLNVPNGDYRGHFVQGVVAYTLDGLSYVTNARVDRILSLINISYLHFEV